MDTALSFEFFPPKTDIGLEKLRQVRQQLYRVKPEFCSVTYGAGGSSQAGTFDSVGEILAEGQSAAAHLSCLGTTRSSARQQLVQLQAMGVRRLVVIRGDVPSGQDTGGAFQYARELIEYIRQETADHFHIEVAAYPETHPQAKSPAADLQALADKVKAGANSAITQYFYNCDAYFRFIYEADRLGVQVPIVPGIMPITNSTQLMRFSDACGAEIPRWIRQRLLSYGDDLDSIRAFGLDVVSDLCDQLMCYGVPALHFYTLNQSAPTLDILQELHKRVTAPHESSMQRP